MIGSLRLRRSWFAALAFPAGVLAVHELRYLLAYGSHAGAELSAHGDDYVTTAAVIAVLLLVVAFGVGLCRLAEAWRGRDRRRLRPVPTWILWAGCTAILIAGFCALEGLEIAFEPSHPAGLAGVFGHGGWWALPAAAAIGALLTLLVQGGRVLLGIAARMRRTRRGRPSSAPRRPGVPDGPLPATPLARCAAGRAPPCLA